MSPKEARGPRVIASNVPPTVLQSHARLGACSVASTDSWKTHVGRQAMGPVCSRLTLTLRPPVPQEQHYVIEAFIFMPRSLATGSRGKDRFYDSLWCARLPSARLFSTSPSATAPSHACLGLHSSSAGAPCASLHLRSRLTSSLMKTAPCSPPWKAASPAATRATGRPWSTPPGSCRREWLAAAASALHIPTHSVAPPHHLASTPHFSSALHRSLHASSSPCSSAKRRSCPKPRRRSAGFPWRFSPWPE